MRALGIRPRQIRLIGGGANNPVWRQIAADAFNAEVVTMVQSESAAFGGALQAMACVEAPDGIAALCRRFVKIDPARSCRPRKGIAAVYRELQAVNDAAAAGLKPAFVLHRRYVEKKG
jgi:xylulokinase